MSVRGAHGCAFHIAEYPTLRQYFLLNFTAIQLSVKGNQSKSQEISEIMFGTIDSFAKNITI